MIPKPVFPADRWERAGATPTEVMALAAAFADLVADEQSENAQLVSSVSDYDLNATLYLMRTTGLYTEYYPAGPSGAPGFGVNKLPGTVTAGAISVPDPATAAVTLCTIGANTTFMMPPAGAGKFVTLVVTQDGTGGWAAIWQMAHGDSGGFIWTTSPDLAAEPGAATLVALQCFDGLNWVGSASPGPDSGGPFLSLSGGQMTGPIATLYSGTSTDKISSLRLSGDPFSRSTKLADGTETRSNPIAPPWFGLNNPTSGGSGSDFQLGLEGRANGQDTAHIARLSFPRTLFSDGTHFMAQTYGASTSRPWSGATVPVTSVQIAPGVAPTPIATILAALTPGTIGVSDGVNVGTCTFTGTTTSPVPALTGVTWSAAPPDASARHSEWTTDFAGAQIRWGSNFGVAYGATDQYHFYYDLGNNSDGGHPNGNLYDLVFGFRNVATRLGGSSLQFGSDLNVEMYRINDGLGDNELKMAVDGGIFTFDFQGIYPSATAHGLGTSTNPWHHIWTRVGTANLPSYAFSSDSSTGLQLPSAGVLGVSAAGAEVANFNANGLVVEVAGTAANAAVGVGSAGVGWWAPVVSGANAIGLTLGTVDQLRFTRNVSTGAGLMFPVTDGSAAGGFSLGTGSPNRLKNVTSTLFTVNGTTGAATSVRLVGGNATGAPASGTWLAGDRAPDLTGVDYFCTVGGTSGTWVPEVGTRVAYNAITTTATTGAMASANTWTAIASGPTITLPNDGAIYEVKLVGLMKNSAAGSSIFGFGTSTTNLLGVVQSQLAAGVYNPMSIINENIVGSGQVLTCFSQSATAGSTSTILGGAVGATTQTPCFLSAKRVA